MKLQILSGALGLVLLLGLVPLQSAEAKVFIIDDFTDDNFAQTCDFLPDDAAGRMPPAGTVVQTGLSGVIDNIRECAFERDLTNPGSNGALSVIQAAGMLRMETAAMVETESYLQYDGEALPANGRSLSLNLQSSDDVRIVFSSGDFPIAVTVTLIDGAGITVPITKNSAALIVVDTDLLFPIADFKIANNALNLGDIDEINVFLDTITAPVGNSDFTLEIIDITMTMVGGEMFPVDTTALLLAGAELNAIWILPAIAAIGIGAFIVSRKRN